MSAPEVFSRVVVVADADEGSAAALADIIEGHGLRPVWAQTRAEVMSWVDRGADAIFLDLKGEALEVGALLGDLRRRQPAPRVVICTHDGRKHHVVYALRQGCVDWVDKPVTAPAVTDALRRLARETRRRTAPPRAPPPPKISRSQALFEGLLGKLERGALAVPQAPPVFAELRPLLSAERLPAAPIILLLEREASLARRTFVLAKALTGSEEGFGDAQALVEAVGPRRVATFMFTAALRKMLNFRVAEYRAIFGPIGQRHLLAAEIAWRLWSAERKPDPDLAFMVALLHDVGEPFLLRVFCELASRFPEHAPAIEMIEPAIRRWHSAFGARLLTGWELGGIFAQVAEDHDRPAAYADDPQRGPWLHLAVLADLIAVEGQPESRTDGQTMLTVEDCAGAAKLSMPTVGAVRAQVPALREATALLR